MSKYIKGDAVANATSYELYKKVGSDYNLLDTKNEIDFNLDEISFESGEHTLVVKAKADGYEDSDFSNEVTYTVLPTEGEYNITNLFTSTWRDGAIIVDSTKTNYGWHQANQTAYRCSGSYVDVTNYTKYFDGENAKLQITVPRATNSSHVQYGLAFYNGTTSTASGVTNVLLGTCPMQYEATDYNNPSVETREFNIPSGTKYIKTTWVTEENEASLGATFSAKIVID